MKSVKKTTQLKNLLYRKELGFLMEAHNGLSAKIVEETGFDGIWASGLSISASLGLRDNNEASWTQVLDVAEYMADATSIPILIDGDTGHGNFNNMRRFVKKCEQRGIAGICIEDKIFPKTNSFLREGKQELARMDEFCGKIKAGLDSRLDPDFCVIARIEAFIAGWGLEEALTRAHAYADAGASAILVHSKLSKADEIFAFMEQWGNHLPVVIVPTKYYATPTLEFAQRAVSTIIWANHNMRAALKAMQKTSQEIFRSQNLIHVEDEVAPLKEVFRLQNDDELMQAEKKYLLRNADGRAIILAASQGIELKELTQDRPKAMLNIQGKPLIAQMVTQLHKQNIEDVTIVRGHKKEAFKNVEAHFIDNDDYQSTQDLYSLYLAKEKLNGEVIIGYGDIVFRSFILGQLKDNPADLVLAVDVDIAHRAANYKGDFVTFSKDPATASGLHQALFLKSIELTTKNQTATAQGEWIGLMKLSGKGTELLRHVLEEFSVRADFKQLTLEDALNYLIKKEARIQIEVLHGHWMDVDTYADYEKIQAF